MERYCNRKRSKEKSSQLQSLKFVHDIKNTVGAGSLRIASQQVQIQQYTMYMRPNVP